MSRTPHSKPNDPTDLASTAANVYLDSLLVMGRQAAEICAPAGAVAQETLLRLRRRLTFTAADPQDFEEAHDVVHTTMREFGRRAKELYDSQEVDYTNLQTLAGRAVDMYSARDRTHLEQLRDITRRLQNASMSGDPKAVQRVSEQAAFDLLRVCEKFQDDCAIGQERFRGEIAALHHRREVAFEAATLDHETGLFTRAAMERRLRDALALGRQFCILKLGVHEFSGLAERHGEQVNAMLRKSAADKLSEQVRPRDVLGQWDDRTFLLIFYDCTLSTAESRADDISAWLSGEYRLYLEDRIVHADVQLTAAATEARPDEHPDEFVARAEALSPVVLLTGAH